MQWLCCGTLAILLLLPQARQDVALDRPVGELQITDPRQLSACDLPAVALQLGWQLHLSVGVETSRECRLSMLVAPSVAATPLRNITPRQAFDHLMTLMPGFSWKEIDGAIVVRPDIAWTDPRDVLNLPTAAFRSDNQRLEDVIDMLLGAVTPNAHVPHGDNVAIKRALIDRSVTFHFRGGTLLAALNAVSRTAPDMNWELGCGDAPNWADLQFATPDFLRGSLEARVALPGP
jgi:hypothetical protein